MLYYQGLYKVLECDFVNLSPEKPLILTLEKPTFTTVKDVKTVNKN